MRFRVREYLLGLPRASSRAMVKRNLLRFAAVLVVHSMMSIRLARTLAETLLSRVGWKAGAGAHHGAWPGKALMATTTEG